MKDRKESDNPNAIYVRADSTLYWREKIDTDGRLGKKSIASMLQLTG